MIYRGFGISEVSAVMSERELRMKREKGGMSEVRVGLCEETSDVGVL